MARSRRITPDLGRAVMVRHFKGRLGRDRSSQAQTHHRSIKGRIGGKVSLLRKR